MSQTTTMTADQAIEQAEQISASISKKLDGYAVFRAQVVIDGIMFLSEPLLRPDVVQMLVNQPRGLRRIDGFRQGEKDELGEWVEDI
jgi:hypothetical protein